MRVGERQLSGSSRIDEHIVDAVAASGEVLWTFRMAPPAGHRSPAPLTAVRQPPVDRIDLTPIDRSDSPEARRRRAWVGLDTCRADRVEVSVRLAQQELPKVVEPRTNAVLRRVFTGVRTGPTGDRDHCFAPVRSV